MRGLILVPLLLSSLAYAQFPEVVWERAGDGAESHYGTTLLPVGDQNDDGYSDWAVVAGGSGSPGQGDESLIDFFHGGLQPINTPYMTLRWPDETTVEYGNASVCGDLNGDGYFDWYRKGLYSDNVDSFRVDVFLGGAAADTQPDGVFYVPINHNLLPRSGTGGTGFPFDFNGDGFDDLYVYYRSPSNYGVVFFGDEVLDFEPDWILYDDGLRQFAALPQTFGDLNGDGYTDIISNNVNAPEISYIFYGGQNPDTIPEYIWDGFTASISYMSADLNGDCFDDLVISRGSHLDIHFGAATLSPVPDLQLNFPGCDNTPIFLASAGDYNRDGIEDLAVIDDACVLGWGKLAVYLGGRWMGSDPAFAIEGRTQPLDLVGIWNAIGIGDVNNDGIEDLAIGATNSNTDGRRGRVVILSGDTTFVVPVNDPAPFLPSTFALHPCYPNPFNSATTISFALDHPGMVRLKVFDITGREVSSLIEESMTAGAHAVSFDGSALASGIYFYSLQSGNQHQTKKMVLLK